MLRFKEEKRFDELKAPVDDPEYIKRIKLISRLQAAEDEAYAAREVARDVDYAAEESDEEAGDLDMEAAPVAEADVPVHFSLTQSAPASPSERLSPIDQMQLEEKSKAQTDDLAMNAARYIVHSHALHSLSETVCSITHSFSKIDSVAKDLPALPPLPDKPSSILSSNARVATRLDAKSKAQPQEKRSKKARKYQARIDLAEGRVRIGGRFVKKEIQDKLFKNRDVLSDKGYEKLTVYIPNALYEPQSKKMKTSR